MLKFEIGLTLVGSPAFNSDETRSLSQSEERVLKYLKIIFVLSIGCYVLRLDQVLYVFRGRTF